MRRQSGDRDVEVYGGYDAVPHHHRDGDVGYPRGSFRVDLNC